MKLIKYFVILLIFIVPGIGGFVWYQYQLFSSPNQLSSNEVFYEVVPGKTWDQVIEDLHQVGVITQPESFKIYVRLLGPRAKLKVGDYAFPSGQKPYQVLSVLGSGISRQFNFTVTEGMNIFEIAKQFQDLGLGTYDEMLGLLKNNSKASQDLGFSVPSYEGFLFPDTYKITKYMKAEDLIKMMRSKFNQVFAEIYDQKLQPQMSVLELVTLASIVEKETGAANERPTISAVFHNRLKKGMLLQTDPTIIYGIADLTGKYEIKIASKDIREPTRYNTYVIKGLPPGPIANPGKEALLAAMKPDDSDYLFFVSKNDGTHIFSRTYDEHNSYVVKFQKDPSARQGKSWRDLNKTDQGDTQ